MLPKVLGFLARVPLEFHACILPYRYGNHHTSERQPHTGRSCCLLVSRRKVRMKRVFRWASSRPCCLSCSDCVVVPSLFLLTAAFGVPDTHAHFRGRGRPETLAVEEVPL